MNLVFNKQMIIILAVTLVISLGLILGVGKSRFQTFRERYASLSGNQTKLANLIKKKESLAQLQKDEARIEAALSKAEAVIPKQKNISDFMIQLEAAPKESGNELKSLSLTEAPKAAATPKKSEEQGSTKETTEEKVATETKSASQYQTIGFSVTIMGDLKQLFDFINLTESLARLTTISSLSIKTTANNLLETKIEGETYYK